MNNVPNQVSFLRTSREFPQEAKELSVELSKAYIDIANVVNSRIISQFTNNRSAQNGENWFITNNQRQQGLRQVYTFTNTSTFPIAHGLNFTNIERFSRMWGQYTDAAGNWYGIISATSVPIAGQLSFYLTPTNIVFLSGAGVPLMIRGFVVLEWLSFP